MPRQRLGLRKQISLESLAKSSSRIKVPYFLVWECEKSDSIYLDRILCVHCIANYNYIVLGTQKIFPAWRRWQDEKMSNNITDTGNSNKGVLVETYLCRSVASPRDERTSIRRQRQTHDVTGMADE